jgi:hypothetical protein
MRQFWLVALNAAGSAASILSLGLAGFRRWRRRRTSA